MRSRWRSSRGVGSEHSLEEQDLAIYVVVDADLGLSAPSVAPGGRAWRDVVQWWLRFSGAAATIQTGDCAMPGLGPGGRDRRGWRA
jgi:hypothetical protein